MKKYKLTALKTKTDTPLPVSVWDFQLSWTERDGGGISLASHVLSWETRENITSQRKEFYIFIMLCTLIPK